MVLPIEQISTVTTPSASYQLVDLATVKTELSIKSTDTSNDATLTREIAYISQLIINLCSAPFAPFAVEARQDVIQFGRDPFPGVRFNGENEMPLSRCPLISVSSVVQMLPNGLTKTLVAGTDYVVDLAKGKLLRLWTDGRLARWEACPLTMQYIGGYGALMAAEVQTVTGSGPYTATPANAAAFAFDQGVTYANGAPLTYVAGSPTAGQYTVSYSISAGALYGFAAADAGASVRLSYAYNIIPQDLVSHTLEIITGRWKSRGRDPSLMVEEQPNLGMKRYWVGGSPGQSGPVPADIIAALNTYRMPKVG